jgi:micrococcal nuclease
MAILATPSYTYRGTIIDIHDGDTFLIDVDLGMRCWLRKQKVRLAGLNAPELGQPDQAGEKARDAFKTLVQQQGANVVVQTKKDSTEKWGRWLATVFVGEKDQINVNAWMLQNGYAKAMK